MWRLLSVLQQWAVGSLPRSTDMQPWQRVILPYLRSAAKLLVCHVTYVGTGVAASGLLRQSFSFGGAAALAASAALQASLCILYHAGAVHCATWCWAYISLAQLGPCSAAA